MNKTKKLTQGSMMIAIAGAMVILDRILGYWLSTVVYLLAAAVIVMYSSMYTVKDGVFASIGLFIVTMITSSFDQYYMIYMPISIITGIAYSMGLKKKFSKTILLIIAVSAYILGEIAVTFIIYPLLGIPVVEQIASVKELYETSSYITSLEALKLDIGTIIGIIYIISVIISGIMEGLLIHILSVFLLKRFRIMNIEPLNLFDIKENPPVAYLSIAGIMGSFLNTKLENETARYALLVAGVCGALVLLFYGYIYITIYGRLVLHKNISTIIILLSFIMPLLLVGLVIVGFLYASGPFRYKLEEKLNINHE